MCKVVTHGKPIVTKNAAILSTYRGFLKGHYIQQQENHGI